jgi:hypothetical protein
MSMPQPRSSRDSRLRVIFQEAWHSTQTHITLLAFEASLLVRTFYSGTALEPALVTQFPMRNSLDEVMWKCVIFLVRMLFPHYIAYERNQYVYITSSDFWRLRHKKANPLSNFKENNDGVF